MPFFLGIQYFFKWQDNIQTDCTIIGVDEVLTKIRCFDKKNLRDIIN